MNGSLIEQAAQRLAQLRQAGVEIPHLPTGQPAAQPTAAPVAAPTAPVPAVAAEVPAQPRHLSRKINLDLDALQKQGVLTPHAPRSTVADQYRVIKRPLIRNAMGKGVSTITHGNLIMVTSALAGEGKSFTSINLAMSIANEMDHTVMLVDADVARPSLPRMLGVPQGPGLLDVLNGSADMRDVLLRTNVEKLTVLPSGDPHPRATELLASDAMRHLLDDIATRYPDRIVIFDSPPLLLTTESRVLATNMGQVVMVVHADKTRQSDVQHALSTIDNCPVRMLVLNQARTASTDGYAAGYGYGYGAGYGYGYGYGDQDRAGAEPSAPHKPSGAAA